MATERRTDIGPPHYWRFLPPIIKENYGKWKYHEESSSPASWSTSASRATNSSRSGPALPG